MSDPTVFGTQGDTPEGSSTNNQTVPTELSEFVGDGKKYATVEDALKSVPHAQAHIATLEKTLNEMRDDLAQRDTAQGLLDKILESKNSGDADTKPTIDENRLEELVSNIVQNNSLTQERAANIASTEEAVKKIHGDNSPTWVAERASEVGVGVEVLKDVAARSPDAFYKMVGLDINNGVVSDGLGVNGSVNTDALQNVSNEAQPHTYEWYQKMRADNPSQYW